MKLDREVVSESVFTSIREAAYFDSLDRMKLIIEKLFADSNGGEMLKSKSIFFQIKFKDVAYSGSSEVMIQILDISERVLG